MDKVLALYSLNYKVVTFKKISALKFENHVLGQKRTFLLTKNIYIVDELYNWLQNLMIVINDRNSISTAEKILVLTSLNEK